MPICSHCGFESGQETLECPLCGTRLGESASTRSDPVGAAGVAWEDPSQAFPASILRTWRDSLFQPSAFFRGQAWDGSLARPLLYYLLVSITSAFFVLLWRSTDSPLIPTAFRPEAPLAPLVQFFFEPFAALIGLAVGVLVLHLFARVFCYCAGPAVFTAVPILGPAVGAVWSVILLVVGLREAHRTTSGRAAAMVIVPLLGFVMLLGLLLVLLIFAGLATGEILEW